MKYSVNYKQNTMPTIDDYCIIYQNNDKLWVNTNDYRLKKAYHLKICRKLLWSFKKEAIYRFNVKILQNEIYS